MLEWMHSGMAVRPRNVSLCATSLVLSHTCAHHSAETLVDVRFWPILLKNSVPEQGRHVTRQPEADLFDPQ